MFSTFKRPLRQVRYFIKIMIKPPIFWLFFMAYNALANFPERQKKFLRLFINYPSFQHHINEHDEKNLIFPYIPKHHRDLSTKARLLYDVFQKNNNQDLR